MTFATSSNPKLNEIELLLNQCFLHNKNPEIGFLGSFPLLRKSFFEGHFVFESVSEKNTEKYVAVCAWSCLNLISGEAYANIGGVAVAEISQGQGIGTKILKKCLQFLETKNLNSIFLYSNSHEFYKKLGFQIGREEFLFVIPKSFPQVKINQQKKNLTCHFWRGTQTIPNEILKKMCDIFSQLEFYKKFEWTPELVANLLAIPATVLCVLETNHELKSFFVVGKGCDFEETIHSVYFENLQDFLFLLKNALNQSFKTTNILYEPIFQNGNIDILNMEFDKKPTGSLMLYLGECNPVFVPALLSS